MALDKELYRRTKELYQQWNEAEFVDSVRNAGKLSPQKAWQQYMDLWEFCMRLSPQPSELQSRRRVAEWEHYYAQIQKLEEWRRKRGRTT